MSDDWDYYSEARLWDELNGDITMAKNKKNREQQSFDELLSVSEPVSEEKMEEIKSLVEGVEIHDEDFKTPDEELPHDENCVECADLVEEVVPELPKEPLPRTIEDIVEDFKTNVAVFSGVKSVELVNPENNPFIRVRVEGEHVLFLLPTSFDGLPVRFVIG